MEPKQEMGISSLSYDDLTIIFVLGGPGSGKGTQCKMIAHKYDDLCHISVGDILRTEQESGTKRAPSGIVVDLIIQAMERSGKKKFLVDGFPRSVENLMAFCSVSPLKPKFVLYISCSQEVMGREDDIPETIWKRIKFFEESSLPVIEYYRSVGILEEINSEMSVEEVFKEITQVFELL
ncbi:hypothetical protein MKW92_010921 [Papaver armeniacum]|nr:hypothetical protein MKW92_010921 [Papaver armeniacum]